MRRAAYIVLRFTCLLLLLVIVGKLVQNDSVVMVFWLSLFAVVAGVAAYAMKPGKPKTMETRRIPRDPQEWRPGRPW